MNLSIRMFLFFSILFGLPIGIVAGMEDGLVEGLKVGALRGMMSGAFVIICIMLNDVWTAHRIRNKK